MTIRDLRKETPKNRTRDVKRITKIALHYSATTSGGFWSFWNNRWKGEGWKAGGYHEIALPNGDLELCYDPHFITNGVANHNSTIYNICYVGKGGLSGAQGELVYARLIKAIKDFNLSISDVLGHKEFKGARTQCPGLNMNAVRSELERRMRTHVSSPTPPPSKNKPEGGQKPGNRPPQPKRGEGVAEYMKRIGMDGSYASRSALASQLGIKGYKGTTAQNIELQNMIASGKAKASKKPTSTSRPQPRKGEGVADYMNRIGMDGSYASRKKHATRLGITGYKGTASQNNRLQQLIASGK